MVLSDKEERKLKLIARGEQWPIGRNVLDALRAKGLVDVGDDGKIGLTIDGLAYLGLLDTQEEE